MLERLGIRDRFDLAMLACLVLLVAVTPAGSEASSPLVTALYRTLLVAILVCYAASKVRPTLPRLSPSFMTGVAAVFALMLVSVLSWPGSRFAGFYLFYQIVLFIAAFIALAHSGIGRSIAWKHTVLAVVVLIDVAYVVGALMLGTHPLIGPFVNPNYLGSFLLPGFAICATTVLLTSSMRLRIAAGAAGLFLYYGIGQTASRGATLSGLALLALGGIRAARRHGISIFRIALTIILLIVVTVAVNPALVQKFLDRGEHDPYNYMRGRIWMGTLAMIAEHPVTGVGLGHFSDVAKLYTPSVETTIAHYRRYPNIAHSEYLQYAAEIGMPGALLLFFLGGYLLRQAWRRADASPSSHAIIQESALLAATGLCVHAFVDNNWTVPVLASGLAVISQADLLPFGKETLRLPLSMGWKQAIALLLLGVWLDAAVIPSVGLYFNEMGHEAHAADNFERAENNHRLALAILPDHPVLMDNLGIVYLDQFMKTKKPQYLDRAEILFAGAMKENPHSDVPAGHLESALMQRLTRNPQIDAAIHRKIIETDRLLLAANPYNPFIRKNLAEAFYNLGERNQAREELLKAVEIEPNYVAGYLRLADWYHENGQMEESARFRNQAIQVVNYYRDKTAEDPFDNLLLGRPASSKHQP